MPMASGGPAPPEDNRRRGYHQGTINQSTAARTSADESTVAGLASGFYSSSVSASHEVAGCDGISVMKANANLHLAAVVVVAAAVAIEALSVAADWWRSDPRLSCEHLLYWGEWIDCMHNSGHLYVPDLEALAVSWTIAGVAMLLGRFAPWYVSLVLPAAAAGILVMSILVLGPNQLFLGSYVLSALLLAGFMCAPTIGACLYGMSARARRIERRRLERAVTAFD